MTQMTQKILNLTQHNATPDQIEAGIFEPSVEDKKEIQRLLTFEEIPQKSQMSERAKAIAAIAGKYYDKHAEYSEGHGVNVMIGGAPYFMSAMEFYLRSSGFSPVYAFSKRESIDQQQPDGSVKKIQVFKHAGFVEV